MDGTWLRDISSCYCLTFLPGPAWLQLSKICKPFFSPYIWLILTEFSVKLGKQGNLMSKFNQKQSQYTIRDSHQVMHVVTLSNKDCIIIFLPLRRSYCGTITLKGIFSHFIARLSPRISTPPFLPDVFVIKTWKSDQLSIKKLDTGTRACSLTNRAANDASCGPEFLSLTSVIVIRT